MLRKISQVITNLDDLEPLRGDRRTLRRKTQESIESEVVALIECCRQEDTALRAVQRTLLYRPAMETGAEDPVVGTLIGACAKVRTGKPEVTGMSYWADSAFIAARVIPTVLFGPGGEEAHAEVGVNDTIDSAHVLAEAARRFTV